MKKWRVFFSKQRRDRKAFRLITSSVRQFDINIHFESIGTMAGMSSYEYGENEQTRISIWYNHLSPFLHLKKVWKICITIWCARHARTRGTLFLKSEWQMTNDAVILYQNAMKIEMPTEVHFHKRQVSLFKIFQHVFRIFCFMLLKSKVFQRCHNPLDFRYNVALVEFSFSILCVSFVTIILFKERFVKHAQVISRMK